jgi:spermidine synthase
MAAATPGAPRPTAPPSSVTASRPTLEPASAAASGTHAGRAAVTSRDRSFPPPELIVFTVGISTLGSEIAAARLMAPFFGASTIVWANTIAVVLVALSVGYWVGGRLADRHPHKRGLCTLVVIASAILAIVPLIADPFLRVSVSAFDSLSVGAFAGSLFGVLALVAFPVMLLGAASPWAIRLKIESIDSSGETAGRMYAISTVGSLLGTFLAALLLIPLVGTQRTFLLFALLLAGVVAFGLPRRYLAAPLIIAVLIAIPPGTIKGAGTGQVLHETETEHQYARVVERPDGRRLLELNEGQAIHSMWRPGTVLTGGVWDGYLVLPLSVLDRPPRSLAILGNGAGTTARAYERYFPDTRIDGVEIDGELTEIGRDYFDLRDRPELRLFEDDARPFLRRAQRRYDAILVDAYRQPYIPFYLSTREFFELARERLRPGGVLMVNAGHPEGSDELEKVLGRTMATAFPHVARDPIEPTNTLLVAAGVRPSGQRLQAAARELPPELARLARTSAARLGPRLSGGRVYTDDRAPVEWLIDKSIVEYAAGAG